MTRRRQKIPSETRSRGDFSADASTAGMGTRRVRIPEQFQEIPVEQTDVAPPAAPSEKSWWARNQELIARLGAIGVFVAVLSAVITVIVTAMRLDSGVNSVDHMVESLTAKVEVS